jgi:hypothetical protein
MNLLISLRSERIKIKRSASFYLAFGAAVFTPFVNTLDLIFDGVGPEHRKTIFNEMFTSRFGTTGALAFPIFIILICTLLPQIEYKNNTWKQVLTSPQTKGNVFLAKFINVQLLIFLFLLANQLLVLVSAVIVHFAEPSLNLLNQPLNGSQIAATLLNSYVALLAITAIQFWLGLRFRNFIVSIGIGMGLWFMGTIMVTQMKLDFIQYFPYSFHMFVSFPKFQLQDLTVVHWSSVGYTALFLLIGYLNFKKRRMSS